MGRGSGQAPRRLWLRVGVRCGECAACVYKSAGARELRHFCRGAKGGTQTGRGQLQLGEPIVTTVTIITVTLLPLLLLLLLLPAARGSDRGDRARCVGWERR